MNPINIYLVCVFIFFVFVVIVTEANANSHATCFNSQKWLLDRYERDIQLCEEGSGIYCEWAKTTLNELQELKEKCND